MFFITVSASFSFLNGFVLEVPRIVPPRCSEAGDRPGVELHRLFFEEASPALFYAGELVAELVPRLTTALMTALSPGQSPPPVSMPIFIDFTPEIF